MTDTDLTTMEDISRTLDALNQDFGWHAPPHETWVLHRTADITDELVASQRVISDIRGAQLQVMTYQGNVYTVSPDIALMTVGTLKR